METDLPRIITRREAITIAEGILRFAEAARIALAEEEAKHGTDYKDDVGAGGGGNMQTVVFCAQCGIRNATDTYIADGWLTLLGYGKYAKHFCSKACIVAYFGDAPTEMKDKSTSQCSIQDTLKEEKGYPESGLLRQFRKASEDIKTWPEWMQRALAEERAARRHITGDVPKESKDR